MRIQQKILDVWRDPEDLLLRKLFCIVLAGRFFYPYFFNPFDNIYSDMARHVDNGFSLLHPKFLNGIDPKTYQVWIHFLQLWPEHEYRSFTALFTGLLCTGMMWFWYKALREMASRRVALIIGIVLGLHLSLLVIYSFLLIETMLLTIVALSAWMTLRAVRKRTLAAFTAAALCWVVAVFTKQTVLPLMLLGLGYALAAQPHKMRAFAVACALFVAALIPAGWQSMKALHLFAPFGFTDMQTISRKSGYTSYGVYAYGTRGYEIHRWWPESFYSNLLDPVATYTSPRSIGTYMIAVNLMKGRDDWDKVIRQVEINRSWHDVLRQYEENVIFLFFSFSWPDSESYGLVLPFSSPEPYLPASVLHWNYNLRWLWCPCFLFVMFYGLFARMTPPKTWIVLIAFTLTWMFLLQDVGIVEGRYRKLIEPFLIVGVFFLMESLWTPTDEKRVSMWDFVKHIYIYPFLNQLLAPVFPASSNPHNQQ